MKKTFLFILVLSLFSIPTVLADRELIINGGFETGDMTGWDKSGPYAYTGGYSGSYSAFINGADSMSQTYFYESMPTSDLTFYAKTEDAGEESRIVAWIYYQDGSFMTHTFAPVTNTWQMYTATTDKTKYISKIAIRTYDENYSGEPDPEGGGSRPFVEDKLVDDVTLSVYTPTINSCEFDGSLKDSFSYMEPVFVKGNYYPPMPGGARFFNVYVVADTTWTSGMTIPTSLVSYYGYSQTAVISPSTDGSLKPTGVVPGSYWDGSTIALQWLDRGLYDIIIDVNRNGKYDPGIDALDDNDVQTGGIEVLSGDEPPDFVIPEMPFGTVMAVVVMFAAFLINNKRPKLFPSSN